MKRETFKTIGIVTIDDYTNYGNRLQNFALTKLFEKRGFKVVNGIQVYTKEGWINQTKNPVVKIIKSIVPFSKVKKRIIPISVYKTDLMLVREKRFLEFVNSYTTLMDPVITSKDRDALELLKAMGIDFFVAGSDQIWNPYFAGKEYQFLSFAPENERFSFSASIGADSIPDYLKWYYKKNLSGIRYISVREERACRIIKEITGRNSTLTLDPTLLLDQSDWELIVKYPNIPLDEKYICTYFLGEIPDAVYDFANRKNLKVYNMNSVEDSDLYVLNPGEFLYMIKNATYVLTDSFHAVVFSIKFKKEFYVFERVQSGVASMFSRIETLTKRFNLANRIQKRDVIIEQDIIYNWDYIENELSIEKEESMNRIIAVMGKSNGKN